MEGSGDREHRTHCTLCGAAFMPDGTGHDPGCWGLSLKRIGG
jgi:hypothetical protein